MSTLIRTAVWTFFVFSVTMYTPALADHHTTDDAKSFKGIGATATGSGTAGAGETLTSADMAKPYKDLSEGKKVTRAMSKVATILKILSTSGKNPTVAYKPKKHYGTSIGYDFTIPGTNLNGSTFYTRPNNKEVWHIALSFTPEALKESPLTKTYKNISQFLGTPQHEMLVMIVSEDDAKINFNNLPPSIKIDMESFADTSGLTKDKVSLAKGINFFTRIKTPTTGAFGILQTAMMMGGTVKDGGTLNISGSLGYDVLGTILKDNTETALDQKEADLAEAEKKKSNIPAVSLTVKFPAVVPLPFNLMVAAKAKKTFYMEIDSTKLSIQYDQAGGKGKLEAQQEISMWIAGTKFEGKDPDGKDIGLIRKVSFTEEKPDGTKSIYQLDGSAKAKLNQALVGKFTLTEVILAGSVKIALPNKAGGAKAGWQPVEASEGTVRNSGITIGAHKDMKKASWVSAKPSSDALLARPSDTPSDKKTTDLMFKVGVTVNAGDAIGDLKGALGLSTVKAQGSKLRIKEVFLQFDGDDKTGGLALERIPLLNKIPLVNKLSINGLGIGVTPPATGSKLGFHLYGALEWKDAGLKGQMAVIKRDTDFYLMSRVTDFSIAKVLNSIKPGIKVPGALDGLKMPDAIMILNTSTATSKSTIGANRGEKDKGADALTLDKLPFQIQSMFNGIVTEAKGKIPIYGGDGLSILGTVDISKDKDSKLEEALVKLGVNVDGKLIVGGSVGGLKTGNPAVALYAKLPNFTFSENKNSNAKTKFSKALQKVISIPTKAGGELFIEFNPKGPIFNIGVGVTMGLKMPRIAGTGKGEGDNVLVAKGNIYLNTSATGEGVRVGAFIQEPWENAMGFEGLTISNVAVVMGVDVEGTIEYGHGGNLKFDLSGSKEKVESKPEKELKDQSAMLAKLAEMDKQFADAAKIDEVTYGFGSILGVNFDAAGIPIPKKLGWSLQTSGLTIPAAIDIFDLFLKGIITGPGADLLKKGLKGKKKKKFEEMQKRFKEENRSRPSEKIAKKFPFPLDALYLKNVELFVATPGAVLPGFPALDGNMGLKIRGELYVRNLKKPKKTPVLVGQADIDLTLGGLNFGDLKDKIKKSYLKFVSATVDGLVATTDCPKGAFYDVGLGSCWSCPKEYKRSVKSVTGAKACKQRTVSRKPAKKLNKINQPWNCAKGSFFSPRNGGECWKCNDASYKRFGSTAPLTSKKACLKIDLSKVTSHSSAKKYKKATGKLFKKCPKGQFQHIGNGYCYSCPKGTIRTARKIGGKKACMKIGGLASYKGAKMTSPGRPSKDAAAHIGSGKFYACPKDYKWAGIGIKAKKACKKVTVKHAKSKSEPRGQIRNLANDLCFGAKNKDLKINAAVVAQKCLDRDSRFQSWYMDHLNRMRPLKQLSLKKGKAGKMCLEVVANDKGKPDTKLIISRCSKKDKESQQWFVDEDDLIHSQLDGGSCVSFSGSGKAGSAMMVAPCITTKNNKSQAWKFGSKLFKSVTWKKDDPDTYTGPGYKTSAADETKLKKLSKKWSAKLTAAAEKLATKREAKAAARKAKKAKKKAAKKQKAPSASANSCSVCVYADNSYKGKFYCRLPGNASKLSPFKLNDKVSSVKFIGKKCKKGKFSLSLYNKINYKSDKIVIKKNTANLGKLKRGKKKKKNWNDAAGSFKFALKK